MSYIDCWSGPATHLSLISVFVVVVFVIWITYELQAIVVPVGGWNEFMNILMVIISIIFMWEVVFLCEISLKQCFKKFKFKFPAKKNICNFDRMFSYRFINWQFFFSLSPIVLTNPNELQQSYWNNVQVLYLVST